MKKIDKIINLLTTTNILLGIILGILLGLLIYGCHYQSPKECCADRGGVQMCYHPNSRTQGYIMCKDGYICSDVRCE